MMAFFSLRQFTRDQLFIMTHIRVIIMVKTVMLSLRSFAFPTEPLCCNQTEIKVPGKKRRLSGGKCNWKSKERQERRMKTRPEGKYEEGGKEIGKIQRIALLTAKRSC